MIQKTVESYSGLVAKHPLIVFLVSALFCGSAVAQASSIETVEQGTEDLLPDSVPSVAAFDTLSQEFNAAGGTTYTVLLETSPKYPNSTSPRDIRNPEVTRYITSTADDLSKIDKVSSVSSPADIYTKTPHSPQEAQRQIDSANIQTRYISPDYTAARIQVTTTGLTTDQQTRIADRIQRTMSYHDRPTGLKISYTGGVYIDKAFQQESQQSQSFTTTVSILGVLVVVVILFRSFLDGISSLLGLIFGIATGLGVYGFLGLNFSPATSGSISIGIGIAIDFGIQMVSRFNEETEKQNTKDLSKALEKALNGVLGPMTVALVAATIGFTALSFGRVTFLSELGTVLTLTTGFAYLGALTLIPSFLVIKNRHLNFSIKKLIT